MRCFPVLASLAVLLAAASATDIKIRVVDPQSAAVSGAQVELLVPGSSTIRAVQKTSAEGVVIFHDIEDRSYRCRVLAPGFASGSVDVSPSSKELSVQLKLAPASETVVVTATRTPVTAENGGADVSVLSSQQLQVMQPVSAGDAVRFLPGAVISTAGQTGNLASLFVRGGNSDYNKVIIDGVSVDEPGGTFNFGTLPLSETGRVEFLRGAQSTLYGSDAMTSVMQVFTRTGSTPVPELSFGADAGNYGTEHGYGSLAGAHGLFDYDIFADQFNTLGRGPNDDYSNSLEGLNVGAKVNPQIALRLRARHDNAVTGIQDEWNFNGQPLLSPDLNERARQNNFLGSFEVTIAGPSRWTHRLTGFEASLNRQNINPAVDPNRISPFGEEDFLFNILTHFNRAGFDYQGDYVERSWAQTTVGYEFEDENGTVTDVAPFSSPNVAHGLRRNQAVYGQQVLSLGRLSVVAGVRFEHNTTFGNVGVPRVALGYQVFRGGQLLSGTRLKFAYTTGIKEPRFEETFGTGGGQIPNPNLKAERNRAFETGFQQGFFSNKMVLDATYFNNLFRDQIEFVTIGFSPFTYQYINLEKSLAHGAEVELQSRVTSKVSWNNSYTYTSTQIIQAPLGTPPPSATGDPLLNRPHHSAQSLLSYLGSRWGANLGANYVGWRPESDFFGYNINHAPSYTLVNAGGWYALTSRVTAYVTINNILNKQYNEVVGYPALTANFRAGMRLRIGGE